MNDAVPGPAHSAHGGSSGVTRRGLLLGGALVVASAGGGAVVAARQPPADQPNKPTGRPPAELVAAVASERALIASIDATTGGSPAIRTALRQVRADHVAHQVALQAAVRTYPEAPAGGSPSSPGAAAALTVAGLRRAEQAAATQAVTRAAGLIGRPAALLASIAACESSHVVLFG